jgi:DnaJ-class molecular chaperone
MFQEGISNEARKWMIKFFLKVNSIVLGIIFIFDGIIARNWLLAVIGIILLPIGAILVNQDVIKDPFHLIEFFKAQFLLWFRIKGPFISRRPYNYYYPEGQIIQQHDVNKTLRVGKKELEHGTDKIIQIKIPKLCPTCGGKRNKPMTVQVECRKCEQGRQFQSIDKLTIPIPCNECLGIGWVPIHPCETCKAEGSIWKKQRIRIHIPPQTTTGTKLRIPALGKVNPKTLHQGDLYIKLKKRVLNII